MSTEQYVRRLVKQSQHLMNVGRVEQAVNVLRLAVAATKDIDRQTEGANLLPRIYHRIAQAEVMRGNLYAALKMFVKSEEAFDPENVIGRSRVLRDYGLVVWEYDDRTEGKKLVEEALAALRHPTETSPRWELEYLVTEGFLARLTVDEDPAKALQVFLRVDAGVRGGSKWVYELDNLEQMIPLLPRGKRPPYLLRASLLASRMVVADEITHVSNLLLEDGKFIAAPFGCVARTSLRMPGAVFSRTRAML